MKGIIVMALLYAVHFATAQELFVYTEPASNMAAKSAGFRLNNDVMQDADTHVIQYRLVPEIMWGVSKKMMVHIAAFMSNKNSRFAAGGGSVYLKYRVFSQDGVHNHFRVALYGKFSFSNSSIRQPAIDFSGYNSGYEGGLVATRLINKIALSASSSLLHAADNGSEKFLFGDKNRTTVDYTFSAGKLLFPKEYSSYRQTNMNCMVELLGQTNLGNGAAYLDIAPAIQFIFNSRIRFDFGYRSPLVSNLHRTAPRGILLRLEYNIFNFY